MDLPCDNHPDQLAALLVTMLSNGDTLTLCGPCVIQWAGMLVGHTLPDADQEPAAQEAVQEAGQPEPDAPTPAPGPFHVFEPPTPEDAEADDQAPLVQEAEAPGE